MTYYPPPGVYRALPDGDEKLAKAALVLDHVAVMGHALQSHHAETVAVYDRVSGEPLQIVTPHNARRVAEDWDLEMARRLGGVRR